MTGSEFRPAETSFEDQLRAAIARGVAIPQHLTPEGGGPAFVSQAVRRVDPLSRELDRRAVEMRANGHRPEHTEESVMIADHNLDMASQVAAQRHAEEAASTRSRRRRRWAAALTTIGAAGFIYPILGAAGTWVAIACATCLIASALLTLKGDD